MLGLKASAGIWRRPLFSGSFMLWLLTAVLLLAGCAGSGNAWSPDPGVNIRTAGGVTPDADGFVPAGALTPELGSASRQSAGLTSAAQGTPAASAGYEPAQFTGQITHMPVNVRDGVWEVAGRTVHVSQGTSLDESQGRAVPGVPVAVTGWERPDRGVDAGWITVLSPMAASSAATGEQAQAQFTPAPAATSAVVPTAQPQVIVSNDDNDDDDENKDDDDKDDEDKKDDKDKKDDEDDKNDEREAKLEGSIDRLPANGLVGTWVIDGRQVIVDRETKIKLDSRAGRLGSGSRVEVKGVLASDGLFHATKMEIKD